MNYFGTNLKSCGHFFWKININELCYSDIKWRDFNKNYFNPEELADDKKNRKLGDVFYFRINGYTICYIEGSCYDTRSGSKSVFFTDEKILWGDLVVKILSIPIVQEMIKQMPFEVRWSLNEEYREKIKNINNL